MFSKKSLRNILKNNRDYIAKVGQDVFSKAISDVFCSAHMRYEIKNFNTLFIYYPHLSEPNLLLLMEKMPKIIFALPKITDYNSKQMGFYTYHKDEPLVKNKFGINEPVSGDLLLPNEKTVIMVPCLAATRNGERLGYGGGYYDRYFARYPDGQRVGVLYYEALQSHLPQDSTDQKLNWILTERGLEKV